MTNGLVLAVYLTLAVITAIMLVVAVFWGKSMHVAKDYIRLCASVFGWQLCEIVCAATNNPVWLRYLYDLKLPFVAFSAVFFLLFTLRFFRMEKYVSRGLTAMLCVVPAFTTVLALTSPMHNFLRARFTVLATSPLHIVVNERGMWFWMHTAYCYLLLLFSGIVILYYFRTLPRAYRVPSAMMLGGALITVISNALVVGVLSSTVFDFTLIGMSLALVFVYMSINMGKNGDFLVMARSEIFNYLDDHVFILDTDRTVQDANESAKAWARELGIDTLDQTPFAQITSKMLGAGDSLRAQGESPDGVDMYLMQQRGQVVYKLRERPVSDRSGKVLGFFATFTDVTRYKLIIDELEKTAGIDPLTGLGNRRSYLMARQKMDSEGHLPLSIVLGDINGLKIVNDTLGHEKGDALLRVAAQLLTDVTGEQGEVFRIGGDEFVVLLPRVGNQQSEAFVRVAEQRFSANRSLGFTPSIALGVATRVRLDQDFDDLVREADRNMYASKMRDRRRGCGDRRIGLPDLRENAVERRSGGDRRSGERREGIPDRRAQEVIEINRAALSDEANQAEPLKGKPEDDEI